MSRTGVSTRSLSMTLFLFLLTACGERADAPPTEPAGPLMNPQSLNETAPETFNARFTTSKGDFVLQVNREWAPHGADRFYNLVKNGFYDGVRFFRVIDGFMVQFGISGDPAVAGRWRTASILDDPVTQSNTRGTATFAMTGRPNSRTTQIFINFVDNSSLDGQGFAPFAQVTEGMDVVDQLYSGYGEGAPSGQGPSQQRMQQEGNAYLEADFPELDYVMSARIEPEA